MVANILLIYLVQIDVYANYLKRNEMNDKAKKMNQDSQLNSRGVGYE